MYFSSTGANPTLTADQGFVVRKHPLVRDPEVPRDAAPTTGAEP